MPTAATACEITDANVSLQSPTSSSLASRESPRPRQSHTQNVPSPPSRASADSAAAHAAHPYLPAHRSAHECALPPLFSPSPARSQQSSCAVAASPKSSRRPPTPHNAHPRPADKLPPSPEPDINTRTVAPPPPAKPPRCTVAQPRQNPPAPVPAPVPQTGKIRHPPAEDRRASPRIAPASPPAPPLRNESKTRSSPRSARQTPPSIARLPPAPRSAALAPSSDSPSAPRPSHATPPGRTPPAPAPVR